MPITGSFGLRKALRGSLMACFMLPNRLSGKRTETVRSPLTELRGLAFQRLPHIGRPIARQLGQHRDELEGPLWEMTHVFGCS